MQIRKDDLTWREVEGEIIVLDLRKSVYLRLNSSGALLWDHLVGGADASGLESVLVDGCGADPDQATRDVETFIEQLRASDLIA